jgi:hypothetical protein
MAVYMKPAIDPLVVKSKPERSVDASRSIRFISVILRPRRLLGADM